MLKVIRNKLSILPRLGVHTLDWHVRYALGKTPSPMACGIYMTNDCNLRCEFCNIWRKKVRVTIERDKVLNLVRELGKAGCFYLSFAGGEPLLVPHLAETVAEAKVSGVGYTHVVTNGYALTRANVLRLSEAGLDEVSISIDGPAEIHNAKRGRDKAYERVVAGIKLFKSHAPHIKIVLNTILTFTSPCDCLHAVELAEKFDIHAKIQPYNCHPAFESDRSLARDDRKAESVDLKAAKRVVNALLSSSCVVNSDVFLKAVPDYLKTGRGQLFKDKPCIYGHHHVEIDESGKVFPCLEGMSWENGFDMSGGLKKLLASKEYRQAVANLKDCKGCERTMYICYYEPRISFPLWNLLRISK
ncbi:radical SAM protein [Desulfobacter vibrioformis]|uniref:radical SAM protein n=1 Tax=Desulfobacter vibrioformis TaxID=34031 RepID=UPI000552FF9B|nr:radical SAM protein [Desulfobacter vibrioformis]